MSEEPRFLTRDDALVIHEDSLLQYGGRIGLPHPTNLESALAAPLQLDHYEAHDLDERERIAVLAAAYWVHLALAHAFADGNKRVAFSAGVLFLLTNGYDIEMTEDEAYDLAIAVAERKIDRAAVAEWIAPRLGPLTDE